MADKIVVLRAGRIEQVGAPLELYHDPANRFVAGFIGSPAMNFVAGAVEADAVKAPGLSAEPLALPVALRAPGSFVTLGLRPQHITLDPAGASHRIDHAEALGGVTYVYLTGPTGERLIVEARGDQVVRHGRQTGIRFDAARLLAFDATTEQRLR